jgi:hypothetical protein
VAPTGHQRTGAKLPPQEGVMQTSGGSSEPPEGQEPQPQVQAAISEGVGLFVHDVVERALGQLKDVAERDLVRDSLEAALTRTVRDIADEELARRQVAAADVGNGGLMSTVPTNGALAERGIEVAREVKELGFVEFTTGLVTGVFDALIASTLKQMDGYAKLVNDIGTSLAQFAAENVSSAEIEAHLTNKYPDGTGGTVVRPNYVFEDSPADDLGTPPKTGNQKLKEVAESIRLATDDLPESRRLKVADLDVGGLMSFTREQVSAIRTAIGFLLAWDMRNMLRDMVREGMARIVVRDGKILTKLTFRVASDEKSTVTQSKFNAMQAGAYVKGEANFLWGKINGGANWNMVNVSAVNEASFDSLTMSTEMIGQVEINFRTETFPPRDIVLPLEPVGAAAGGAGGATAGGGGTAPSAQTGPTAP